MAFIYRISIASIFTSIAALGLYTVSAKASDSFRNISNSVGHNYQAADRSKPDLSFPRNPKILDERKPTINGFHLETKDSDIYRKLGKPTRRKNTFGGIGLDPNGGCMNHAISIYYSGLEIDLTPTFQGNRQIGRQIYTIIDTDRRYKTNMGFRVGDNISKAERAFTGLGHTSKTVNNRKQIFVTGIGGVGEGVTVEAGTDDKINKIKIDSPCA